MICFRAISPIEFNVRGVIPVVVANRVADGAEVSLAEVCIRQTGNKNPKIGRRNMPVIPFVAVPVRTAAVDVSYMTAGTIVDIQDRLRIIESQR